MRRKNRILVVDDDLSVQESYQSILAEYPAFDILSQGVCLFKGSLDDSSSADGRQYDLTLCEKGELGVLAAERAVAEGKPFSVAFIDINMPGMDGAETARRLWLVDLRIKIVMVTAYGRYTPDDIINVTHRDDLFFLRKPFHSEEIRQFARTLTKQWALENERDCLLKELLLAKSSGEKVVEARSAFLSNVTHEIRTPLNVILGMIEILASSPLTSEQKEYLEYGHSEGFRLLRLFNDLIDISCLEAGRVQLVSNDINLFSLVEYVCTIMQSHAMEKGLKLSWQVARDVPPRVQGDRVQVEKILRHLIENSIKFTKEGEIEVKVELKTASYDHEAQIDVLFCVRDTGIGIPPEKSSAIFESFTQADSSGTRKYGGMGIGLPITKKLVELMGGGIGVANRVEGGSSFHFNILFGLPSKQSMAGNQVSERLKGSRILLLADSSPESGALATLLRMLGFSVSEAGSVQDVMIMLRHASSTERGYEAVFLDCMGSFEELLQTAERIKTLPGHSGRVITLISSQLERPVIEKLADLDIRSYLVKPVCWAALREILKGF